MNEKNYSKVPVFENGLAQPGLSTYRWKDRRKV